MSAGYFKMYRGWQKNSIFGNDKFSRRDAWAWLIENAAFQETKIWIAGSPVELQPGQLCYAYRFLASAWGWSIHAVQNFIAKLKTDTMIETHTDTGRLFITICNYKKYQIIDGEEGTPSDTQEDTARVRDGYGAGTKKEELKQSINKSPRKKRGYAEHPRFADCWPHYPKRDMPNPRDVASARFTQAIEAGADPDAIIAGVKAYAEHCRKENKIGTGYVLGVRRFFDERTWEGYSAKGAAPRPRPSVTDPDFLQNNPDMKGQAA